MDNLLIMKMTGVRIFIRTSMIPAIARAMESALIVASVFGVTSPKIRIRKVSIPVAIPAPTLPKYCIVREVAREEADRLTILLPIRMAESILPESSVTRRTLSARLLPDSDRVRMRILLTVVRAVSDDEKNAESSSKSIKIISCTMSPGVKKIHLIIKINCVGTIS